MGSRRARSKAEGTFLEKVKDSLDKLALEVSLIKGAVKDVQASCQAWGYIPSDDLAMYVPSGWWIDGQTWTNLQDFYDSGGFDSEKQHVNEGGAMHVGDDGVSIAQPCDTLARETLLAFRNCEFLAPKEIETLTCVSLPATGLNPSATEFVPREYCPDEARELGIRTSGASVSKGAPFAPSILQGDWRRLPENSWHIIYDRFTDDAATSAQWTDDEKSENYRDICVGCRESLSPDSDLADTCDRCCALHHHDCLIEVPHPLEPYRLCLSCAPLVMAQTGMDDPGVLTSVGNDHDAEGKLQVARVVTTAEPEALEKQCIGQAAIVDTRLDFMLRYLELDTHGTLAPDLRHAILQKVKRTKKWKEKRRSLQALKDKVVDLDKSMEILLQKFQGRSS